MTIEQAYDFLTRTHPRVIHLSGKTSTGKSTLAGRLQEALGYEVVSLDELVHETIDHLGLTDEGQAFVDIYRTREHPGWAQQFVLRVKQKVSAIISDGRPVILDGAVANTDTLQEVLAELPDPVILYIHPQNLERYERNLTSRFMTATQSNRAGLPVQFWNLIDSDSFAVFCQTGVLTNDLTEAIHRYAHASREASEKRLADLQAVFEGVLVAYL